MTKKNYLIITLLSLLTLIFLSSCGAIVKSKADKFLTEENGAIPPDFGKEETTLLFITHRRSYNKYLKTNVKKIYNSKYEFINEDQLKSESKYNNINKYRYLFNYDEKSYTYYSPKGGSKTGYVKKFYVLDRKSDKRFYSKLTSGLWSKLQKVYLKKLNEKIIKEQGS